MEAVATEAASCEGLTRYVAGIARFKSTDLFRQARQIEIEHEGRIYQLRLTAQNRLILTA